jgi:hypothetical protein
MALESHLFTGRISTIFFPVYPTTAGFQSWWWEYQEIAVSQEELIEPP